MSQSTLKTYFKPTREEPAEKRRKQLSIDSFAVPVDNILDDNDEITIVCPPKKSKIKNPVGRPRKSVDLDLEEFHDFNDLWKESVRL